MSLITPSQLSIGPKYISLLERAEARFDNKFWDEMLLPNLIDENKDSYVLLSDSPEGNFSHTYTELLADSILEDHEIQARAPFFTNILRIPTFDINRRRSGASGWERPSTRIINGGWMVFTFECDDPSTGALEHQMDWFMGKTPPFETVHQRLKQFHDYRGYNTVFSGNKSLHIDLWFDTRHLSRDLSKQTRRKGNDWAGDMPPDAIKELYRDKWCELAQIIGNGLNETIEFDDKLSFYAQKRRMPWGVREIEIGDNNIHNVQVGDKIVQSVIAEQFLSRKSTGSTDWFIKVQDADKIMAAEREASGEISKHPVTPQATTQLVRELSVYLKNNGWGQYPEPVEVSYSEPYNYLWFKNHADDIHPRTFVRGDYRRIPERLRPLFQGHREYKVALKTNDISEAVGRWRVANVDFEATLKVEADLSNSRSDDIVQSASALLKSRGIHPDQAPSITAKSTTEQSSQFERWVDYFKMKEDEFVQEIADEQLDYAQRQRDYDRGIWGSPDYQEPYKPMDPRSPKTVALRIMRGELNVGLKPTLTDLVEVYLSKNLKRKVRNPEGEAKFERSTRSIFKALASDLPDGMDTEIDSLERNWFEDFLERCWPNASSRKKSHSRYVAAINTYNRENSAAPIGLNLAGLVTNAQVQKDAVESRSFTPNEFELFLKKVRGISRTETRLIGLVIAYTGTPNTEAAGLMWRDVKLDDPVPHMIVRDKRGV
ncbi:MAG: hypothetical protein ACI9HA_003547 [Dinoroseobacter sp.]|jgi:hypothetical protein